MVRDAPRFDAVVIGAGLSGLVVAYRATGAGLQVAVVDAASHPGGVIDTRERDGFRFETAANSALDNHPRIGELIADLGIVDERVAAHPRASKRYIVRDGRLEALPSSPPELVTTRALRTSAKLALLREPFVAASPPGREESVDAFARRRLGKEIADYAVDPFVGGIHAGKADELSFKAAFPRLYELEQRHGSLIVGQFRSARERSGARSFSFRDGMRTLPRALARDAGEVMTSVRIETLRQCADGFEIAGTRSAEPLLLRSRAVVVAAPAYVAETLIRSVAPEAADALARIDYAPVAIVATAYRAGDVAHPLDGFGFLAPTKERRPILGALFSSSAFDGRAPADHVLLTTFTGGRRRPEVLELDDTALCRLVEAELASLLGARAPLWSEVVRWPRAIPQYTLGHLDRIASIDARIACIPGLILCGSWRGGVAIGDCIANGYAVAARLAAYCEA